LEPEKFPAQDRKLHDALGFMERALQLLDDSGCSADVGAHLDLAICRLREVLPDSGAGPHAAEDHDGGSRPMNFRRSSRST
jgi:hypothetical protein